MSDLVAGAFGALGMAPSLREVELVAAALRASGDEDALALFEAAEADRDGFKALAAVATASGSCGLVALDLLTEVSSPGAHERVLARGPR